MKLFILSAAISFDTKTFILILLESYFSTVINVDRAGLKLMNISFRRLWYFLSKVKDRDLIRYTSKYNVLQYQSITWRRFFTISK